MDYTAYARSIRRELHEYPEIGFDLPAPAADTKILERLAEMSQPYGAKMEINGNIAAVMLE